MTRVAFPAALALLLLGLAGPSPALAGHWADPNIQDPLGDAEEPLADILQARVVAYGPENRTVDVRVEFQSLPPAVSRGTCGLIGMPGRYHYTLSLVALDATGQRFLPNHTTVLRYEIYETCISGSMGLVDDRAGTAQWSPIGISRGEAPTVLRWTFGVYHEFSGIQPGTPLCSIRIVPVAAESLLDRTLPAPGWRVLDRAPDQGEGRPYELGPACPEAAPSAEAASPSDAAAPTPGRPAAVPRSESAGPDAAEAVGEPSPRPASGSLPGPGGVAALAMAAVAGVLAARGRPRPARNVRRDTDA